MTLGEGKKKVLELMDEYSSGGQITVDEDIMLKMVDFFDIAQKEVAKIKKLRRTYAVEREVGKLLYEMPGDFMELEAVWVDGARRTNSFAWRGKSIFIPERLTGKVEVDYFAVPQTIPADATDDYGFEVDEDAANAMPYFVASQQLITDLIIDYGALYALYQACLSTLDTSPPGGLRLLNTFFRR